jgi:hypothetical protein
MPIAYNMPERRHTVTCCVCMCAVADGQHLHTCLGERLQGQLWNVFLVPGTWSACTRSAECGRARTRLTTIDHRVTLLILM